LGKTSSQPGIEVADGARLVIRGNIVSLADVIAGKSKNCSLVEKSEKSPVSVQLKMNDAEDAAYLILGTQPEGQKGQRVHTVLFMKDANGKWLIENWHTSN
jgi:ketosteroid isomerase-like protein